MVIQPPSITPRQMNLMRIVLAMAWADGNLSKQEADVMLSRFTQVFATSPERQQALEEELRGYLIQDIPLEELTPKLHTIAEKEFVLRLSYEVISSSSRVPDEALINHEESQAYQKLVSLLALPADAVHRIETEAQAAMRSQSNKVIDLLVYQLRDFFRT